MGLVMDKLALAIYLSELAYIDYERRCADVWSEFIRVDPWLALEVKKLGYPEEGLAEWVPRSIVVRVFACRISCSWYARRGSCPDTARIRFGFVKDSAKTRILKHVQVFFK